MVDGTKGGNLARFAEHLVDFACVKLLGIDHLPGILLDNDRVPFSAFEQFAGPVADQVSYTVKPHN